MFGIDAYFNRRWINWVSVTSSSDLALKGNIKSQPLTIALFGISLKIFMKTNIQWSKTVCSPSVSTIPAYGVTMTLTLPPKGVLKGQLPNLVIEGLGAYFNNRCIWPSHLKVKLLKGTRTVFWQFWFAYVRILYMYILNLISRFRDLTYRKWSKNEWITVNRSKNNIMCDKII